MDHVIDDKRHSLFRRCTADPKTPAQKVDHKSQSAESSSKHQEPRTPSNMHFPFMKDEA